MSPYEVKGLIYLKGKILRFTQIYNQSQEISDGVH